MNVEAYLFFNGRTEEAIEFYKKAIGAKPEMVMRYGDSPDKSQNPPGSDDKIMHSSFMVGDSRIMASDGECSGQASFQGFSLSITAESEAEADRVFSALSEGGQVQMPLSPTFFSPKFGMLVDKFGIGWMIMAAPQEK